MTNKNYLEYLQYWKPLMEIEQSRKYLFEFVKYTHVGYQGLWFHKLICHKIDRLIAGDYNRLMIFMPPQHGKSEIVSCRLPAYLMGLNPDIKTTIASYSQDLSSGFNRDVQRIIQTDEYSKLFDHIALANTGQKQGYQRNTSKFDIVGHKGFLASVGVMTGLTGKTIDFGIIDDPIKDYEQAYSQRYRERLWEWYVNVFKTRIHNRSKVLLTMTRWHYDDLAGRILANIDPHEHWEIVTIPGIKEDEFTIAEDPRQTGEALWQSQHGVEKIMSIKANSPTTYNSLYQQRPSPKEGLMIKESYFGRYRLIDLIDKCEREGVDLVWNFTIDGAFTADTRNDPTAILCYTNVFNNTYIRDVSTVFLELPALLNHIKDFARQNDYSRDSRIYIEPKASGVPAAQSLRDSTDLNVILDKAPTTDKVSRVMACLPYYEAGRVKLLENAGWIPMFVNEHIYFPGYGHDDIVDVTTMAIDKTKARGGSILLMQEM